MEAALRTAVETITGKKLNDVEFKEVRGMNGVKEATYSAGDLSVKVAVVSGLKNASELCDKVKNGQADYQFIEVMSCPGGCVNGGGQPFVDAFTRSDIDYKAMRAKGLYDETQRDEYLKSEEKAVKTLEAKLDYFIDRFEKQSEYIKSIEKQ